MQPGTHYLRVRTSICCLWYPWVKVSSELRPENKVVFLSVHFVCFRAMTSNSTGVPFSPSKNLFSFLKLFWQRRNTKMLLSLQFQPFVACCLKIGTGYIWYTRFTTLSRWIWNMIVQCFLECCNIKQKPSQTVFTYKKREMQNIYNFSDNQMKK